MLRLAKHLTWDLLRADLLEVSLVQVMEFGKQELVMRYVFLTHADKSNELRHLGIDQIILSVGSVTITVQNPISLNLELH